MNYFGDLVAEITNHKAIEGTIVMFTSSAFFAAYASYVVVKGVPDESGVIK